MNRSDVLDKINKLIKVENGSPITEEDKIVDSGIDSLGISILFMEIDAEYSIYPKEVFEAIDFSSYTVKEMIDEVIKSVHK